MAITFAQLQGLLNKEGYRYFIAPDHPVVRLGVNGQSWHYELVIQLHDEGKLLQIRSVNYLRCPANHSNVGAVLRLLAGINYEWRYVKFGWDQADGEIAAYGDLLIRDNQVTQEQFSWYLGFFLSCIDAVYPRFKTVIETGIDPAPKETAKSAAGGPVIKEI
jgi:hypothetical protein